MAVSSMEQVLREYESHEGDIDWHSLSSVEAYNIMEGQERPIDLFPIFNITYQGNLPKFVVDYVACKKLHIIRPKDV